MIWLVFLMYALFASIFPVGKWALSYAPPFFLTGWRMLIAGGLLIAFQYWKAPSNCIVHKNHWPYLIVIAIFNVFITNGFEFWGLQFMLSAKTSLLYSLAPFVALVLSHFFLKEKMSPKKWIGLLIGMGGFLPIYLSSSEEEKLTTALGPFTLPELAVTVSAITSVIGWIFVKKLTHDKGYPVIMANGISFLLAGILSLALSFFIESWPVFSAKELFYFSLGLFYIILIHNLICYHIYGVSLKKFSVTFMSFAGFSSPLFAAFFGWLFLGEMVGIAFCVSFVLILTGLLIYSKEELKMTLKEPSHDS